MSDKRLRTTARNNGVIHQEGIFNQIRISGVIEEEFAYSHQTQWMRYYKTRVRVKRLSGTEDYVPIIVSEMLIANISEASLKGRYVEAEGQFRSFNKLGEDGRKHLELFLFATAFTIQESEEESDANLIYLDGYICMPPIFRVTPLGRKITDLMVIVYRKYDKYDNIPCIAWGEIAQYASELKIADRIKLYGRVQSRRYFKKSSPDSDEGEYKTAYEISITRMKKVQGKSSDDK